MTIAINPGTAFDIETYDGLLAFVTEHLELDEDTVAQLPSLLRASEARIDRLCVVPERESSMSFATTSGTQSYPVPVDYRHAMNLRMTGTNGRPLEQVSQNYLHDQYTNLSGEPIVFANRNGNWLFGPIPDAAYTIEVSYLTELSNLSPTNQTNWLLSENPDLYLYALLYQTSVWLEDLDAATAYRAELLTIIDEVNLQGRRYRRTRGMRLRSPVVV